MSLPSKPMSIAILVLISICCVLFLRLQTLHEHTERLQQSYTQEHLASDQRQHIIERLQQQITTLNEQQRRAAEAQTELKRLALDRLAILRKLEDENSHLRLWADYRLPTEFGRLRDRDALSSASAYSERLRNT